MSKRMASDNRKVEIPPKKGSKRPAGEPLLSHFKDYIPHPWIWIQNLRFQIFLKLAAYLKDYTERRAAQERRIRQEKIDTQERRSGQQRRSGQDQRSGEERRSRQVKIDGQEQRSGEERRSRQSRLRIPIFIKLSMLSALLIFMVIFSISISMLKKQKQQFVGQLINLGESMVHIAAKNAPDKLLGEEELALFQLVKDIAENDQVIYALITDTKNIIKAHSSIDEVNKAYSLPKNMIFLKESDGVNVSSFIHGKEEILFFEKPITYQKLGVGKVCLAISQKKILHNIRDAKTFILLLTLIIIFVGILLSLGMSKYFSSPIQRLRESTKFLGMGDFDHQVSIKRSDELGDLGSAFNKMANDLALKEKIKDSFGRYVTPEIVDLILANPDSQWMKGSEVEATVLFVDIRGFTALSEKKEPEKIVEMLNNYFTRVTDIVIKHGGHLNKFVGDEAMAIFGTPVPNPQHAEVAVKTALNIQDEITRFYPVETVGDMAIQVGIGINSGVMVAGNLGSEKRMEYTVIGDNVNVASRLTSLAKAGEILISKRTYELINKEKNDLEIEQRGKVPVKGRKMKIDVFNVLSLGNDQHGKRSKKAV